VTFKAHENSVVGLSLADTEGDETLFSLSLDNTVKAWAFRFGSSPELYSNTKKTGK